MNSATAVFLAIESTDIFYRTKKQLKVEKNTR